jgi:hypothetical protein
MLGVTGEVLDHQAIMHLELRDKQLQMTGTGGLQKWTPLVVTGGPWNLLLLVYLGVRLSHQHPAAQEPGIRARILNLRPVTGVKKSSHLLQPVMHGAKNLTYLQRKQVPILAGMCLQNQIKGMVGENSHLLPVEVGTRHLEDGISWIHLQVSPLMHWFFVQH